MRKIANKFLFLQLLLAICAGLNAQSFGKKTLHIGIAAPLYLDSVFNNKGAFKYQNAFPKFAFPGLDFVQGARLALESLSPSSNTEIIIRLIDSKSSNPSLSEQIQKGELDELDMIIGSVKDAEFKTLADFANTRNIPFVSATYPNDGGISNNPFLIIVNSTLRAHCEALFAYLLQNHSMNKIYLIRHSGNQEDKVEEYFKATNRQADKPLLKIQTLNLEGDMGSLASKLDSNAKSVIIGGSLQESFAESLCNEIDHIRKKYNITLVGMPNWEGFSFLKKSSLRTMPLIYTSSFFNNRNDSTSKEFIRLYQSKFKGMPSDLAFKGYEMVSLFIPLLISHPESMNEHLDALDEKIFCEYNFKPIYLGKNKFYTDYYENKHLYILKMENGQTTKAP